MPVQVSYPGVYVQEISSGVRTIAGVSTSVAAFVGRTRKGPVNDATTIFNMGDFDRKFGGLWDKSPLSFSVRDFFLNGGSEAVIVRVHNSATAAVFSLPTEGSPNLELGAASPGSWGNDLSIEIDYDTKDPDDEDLFNITIIEEEGARETFLNVSVDENGPDSLERVLEQNSDLMRVRTMSSDRPIDTENYVPSPLSSPPEVPIPYVETTTGSDGDHITDIQLHSGNNMLNNKEGIYALESTDIFNLLCVPSYTDLDGTLADNDVKATDVTTDLINAAAAYCKDRRALLIIDPPSNWTRRETAREEFTDSTYPNESANRDYAAIFFPRLKQANPLMNNQIEDFVPCGAVAGTMARTDTERGVWKAPAGTEAGLAGVKGFSVPLTDAENGNLNKLGINCLRSFPVYGNLVWGARTLDGADVLGSEWKYIPVRRTALFIEESLYRGLKWVVFEPNDEPLWAQIRLNVGAFMHNLYRQGAFQGKKNEAYFVKCDSETTTQNDINLGIVRILVGFAPLKPAEFVIINLQQIAGQIET